ncbi:hypothetical protein OROGR_020798 [Orobanche gracilis]
MRQVKGDKDTLDWHEADRPMEVVRILKRAKHQVHDYHLPWAIAFNDDRVHNDLDRSKSANDFTNVFRCL